jgi:hypothetical protein
MSLQASLMDDFEGFGLMDDFEGFGFKLTHHQELLMVLARGKNSFARIAFPNPWSGCVSENPFQQWAKPLRQSDEERCGGSRSS